MAQFISINTNNNTVDVNVASIETVVYTNGVSVFTLKNKAKITANGDWQRKFRKFLASGANWTDGEVYEYNR